MTDLETTALERAMVKELLVLSMWIESLPDDTIDIDEAVKIQEDIAFAIEQLDEADRSKFVAIATQVAAEADASRPGEGEAIREALAAFWLLDEP
jgi:hypothetical protein